MIQSASNTRIRVTSITISLVLGIAALALSAHLPGAGHERSALRTVSLPDTLFERTLGYRFGERDLKHYAQAFRFQKAGNWRAADRALSRITDDTLKGAVLAERYLHEDYDSQYAELVTWLTRYRDMPQAAKIHALARHKRPPDSTLSLPPLAETPGTLGGAGLRDGIHGQKMPAAWKAGLTAWQNEQYTTAAGRFAEVAGRSHLSAWHRSAAHYWAYRAYRRLEKPAKAETHLEAAAAHPLTLYGLMANEALARTAVSPTLPVVSAQTLAIPAVKRAAMYRKLGRRADAEAELRVVYPKLPAGQRRQLATVAARLNLPALQIRAAQVANLQATDIAAYPTPDWIAPEDMLADPALVYAVIRQESAFVPGARNVYSGALGAMQLMPRTARYVIRRYGLDEIKLASLDVGGLGARPISVARLREPAANLTVGQHYIQYLADKPYIRGNLIYLLAAYNAGPSNLLSWQARYAAINDPLLFMEKIPFRETRQYVKQVLANYIIYRQMLAADYSPVARLANAQWPTMTAARDNAPFVTAGTQR